MYTRQDSEENPCLPNRLLDKITEMNPRTKETNRMVEIILTLNYHANEFIIQVNAANSEHCSAYSSNLIHLQTTGVDRN